MSDYNAAFLFLSTAILQLSVIDFVRFRPQQLPQIEQLHKLKGYMLARMQALLTDEFLLWTLSDYVELRDIACARLTLFNARRGGEPARLSLADWNTGCNRDWFDSARLASMGDEERQLFSESTIMYQTGKGANHLVPVIVPPDTVRALEKLADADLRRTCGVKNDNVYLFPSTLSSEGHVSGWHAINTLCEKAGVPPKEITATKMRHFTSTLYASLDIPEDKRSAFYRHMGHSKSINETIYQTPLAEVEIRDVGSVLTVIGRCTI